MAPLPELLTVLGRAHLEMIPPFLRGDPDYVAVMHCYAREAERLGETLELVRANLDPTTATELGLPWYESVLHVSGTGTVEERRSRVLGRLAALAADPSGRSWVRRVTARIGSGWSYVENTPDPQTIRVFVTPAVGTAAWDEALRAVREETPAEQELDFVSSEGFLLDETPLDTGGLGV